MDLKKLADDASQWFQDHINRRQLFGEASLVMAIGQKLPEDATVEVEKDFRSISGTNAPAGYFNYDLAMFDGPDCRYLFEMKFLKSVQGDFAIVAYDRVVDDLIKLSALACSDRRCFFVIAYSEGSRISPKVEKLLSDGESRPVLVSTESPSATKAENLVQPSKRLVPSVEQLKEFVVPFSRFYIRHRSQSDASKYSIIITIYEVERM